MPDMKISAMPAATQVANADVMPVVQAGVNKKCTRQLMLTAAVGEDISIVGAATRVINVSVFSGLCSQVMTDAGGVTVTCDGFLLLAMAGGGSSLGLPASGDVVASAGVGRQVIIDANLGAVALTLNPTGGAPSSFIDAAGIVVSYLAGAPASWAAPVPIDLATAVDRLALRVAALSGPV